MAQHAAAMAAESSRMAEQAKDMAAKASALAEQAQQCLGCQASEATSSPTLSTYLTPSQVSFANQLDSTLQPPVSIHSRASTSQPSPSPSQGEAILPHYPIPVQYVNIAPRPLTQQQLNDDAQRQTKNHALQDYQMQLMLLEQQNKRRLMMANGEASLNAANITAQQPADNQAVQDYQMQLMLLEQQNKKRLMMARVLQDTAQAGASSPGQ